MYKGLFFFFRSTGNTVLVICNDAGKENSPQEICSSHYLSVNFPGQRKIMRGNQVDLVLNNFLGEAPSHLTSPISCSWFSSSSTLPASKSSISSPASTSAPMSASSFVGTGWYFLDCRFRSSMRLWYQVHKTSALVEPMRFARISKGSNSRVCIIRSSLCFRVGRVLGCSPRRLIGGIRYRLLRRVCISV